MSDMKCPICGKDLVEIELDECWFLVCCNSKCRCNGVASDTVWKYIDRTRKALDYCIERFKSLENVLDEKAEASDIPDNPDLYAWAVRIKPIWGELKEIIGIDYKGGDNE